MTIDRTELMAAIASGDVAAVRKMRDEVRAEAEGLRDVLARAVATAKEARDAEEKEERRLKKKRSGWTPHQRYGRNSHAERIEDTCRVMDELAEKEKAK